MHKTAWDTEYQTATVVWCQWKTKLSETIRNKCSATKRIHDAQNYLYFFLTYISWDLLKYAEQVDRQTFFSAHLFDKKHLHVIRNTIHS